MRIILDFDYTVFDTEAMRRALIEALAVHGVTEKRYREVEKKLKENGGLYTLEAHLAEFASGEPTRDMREAAYGVLTRAEEFLFSDVLPWLKEQHKHEVTLLSFGSPDWQARKMRDSGVDMYADEVIATDKDKADVVKQYAGEDVVVINDRGSEIDAMHAVMPQARYVWVRRPGTKYVNEPCQWYTDEVESFDSLVL